MLHWKNERTNRKEIKTFAESHWTPLASFLSQRIHEVMKLAHLLTFHPAWNYITKYRIYSKEKLKKRGFGIITRYSRKKCCGSELCIEGSTELSYIGVEKSQVLCPVCSYPAGKHSYACPIFSGRRLSEVSLKKQQYNNKKKKNKKNPTTKWLLKRLSRLRTKLKPTVLCAHTGLPINF